MTSVKISALPAASTLDGGETVPVVQDGETRRATASQIAAFTGALLPSNNLSDVPNDALAAENLSVPYGVPTLAALKALTARPAFVFAEGETAFNDGWGGPFGWEDDSATAADDLNIVAPTAGDPGRYERLKQTLWEPTVSGSIYGKTNNLVDFAAAQFIRFRGTLTSLNVTNATNNGSGLIRLALASEIFAASGVEVTVAGVGGVSGANGLFRAKIVSTTTIDLIGSSFSGTYTSGGTVQYYATGSGGIQWGDGGVIQSWDDNSNVVYTSGYEGSPTGIVLYGNGTPIGPSDDIAFITITGRGNAVGAESRMTLGSLYAGQCYQWNTTTTGGATDWPIKIGVGGVVTTTYTTDNRLGIGIESLVSSTGNKAQIASDVVQNTAERGQLLIAGSTSSLKQLWAGFDTTSNYGFLQAVISGTGYVPLVLQKNGGKVGIGNKTSPSTLLDVDDYITAKGMYVDARAAPGSPATSGTWVIYSDSGDGNKLKAKASTGTVVTLGTP